MDAEPQLLDDALEARVLDLWAGVLGVDANVLDRDGLVVVADPLGASPPRVARRCEPRAGRCYLRAG